MPIIPQPGSSGTTTTINSSSISLQEIVNDSRAYAELAPQLSAGGYTQRPALPIANSVMQKILSVPLNWKWNRGNVTPFLTVALQQDYVTSITNLGWLEQGWKVDINNSSLPQPTFGLETVRDLARTSYQGNPFNLSWIPNRLATMGTWKANTSYPTGLGQAMTPVSPIQQFIDSNGNILYVTTNGTSGNSAPAAAVSAAPGTTVADNTVVWTVADPNAIAIRTAPMPASSGIVWQITPVYQLKPPKLTSLQTTISPIPDDYAYVFRDGFNIMCRVHAGAKDAREEYVKWEESLFNAIRSADREREDASFFPSRSITDDGFWGGVLPLGASNPYSYGWGGW